MKTHEYFTKQEILWFPINLKVEGKTKKLLPYTETGCRPTMNDFESIEKVNKHKEYTQYKYGAIDTRHFQHIDVDLKKDKKYDSQTVEFVENLKNKIPYFPSITKRNPHFIIKNENLGDLYRIQTIYEDIEILSGQWSYFKLDDDMINYKENITPIDEGIVCDITKKNNTKKNDTKNKRTKIINDLPIDEDLQDLVDCISIDDINDYDSWIRLVFALHNDNINNYEIAQNMSLKSTKYDETFFNNLWSNAKDGINIGTIHYYAKKGNPAKYRTIKMKDELTGTDDNLTEIFLKLNCEDLVYNKKLKKLYIYKCDNWLEDNEYLVLKKLIRKSLIKYVSDEITYTLENSNGKDVSKIINEYNKVFQKVSNKKTIDSVCSFVIQDLADCGKEENFDINDAQLYNLHFRNGVYNLKEKKFRTRKKTDYITQYLNWDYLENEEISENIKDEVLLFYKKLHPDEEQRKFALSWLAYCLCGDIGLQKFKMNIGYTASNGKSTEFKIHDSIFPIYSKKLDKDTFNLSYAAKRHKQIIQLQLNPIRFVYCEEIDQKKIDTDFLKEFVDASNLSCEVLYGTTNEGSLQCKYNTCSNKDFNIDIDEGIVRRGLVQMYESQFLKDVKDDWENNKFRRIDNYGNKFKDEKFKNAYLHLLISHFSLDGFVPKKNEEMFKEIAEEYDEFGSMFHEEFIKTDIEDDIMHKSEIMEIMKYRNKNFSQRQITYELKKLGVKYKKDKMKDGKKGYFIGIKSLNLDDED